MREGRGQRATGRAFTVVFWATTAVVTLWLVGGLTVGVAAAVPSVHEAFHRWGATTTSLSLTITPDGLETEDFPASEVVVAAGRPLTLRVTNERFIDQYLWVAGGRAGPVAPGTSEVYRLNGLNPGLWSLGTDPLAPDGILRVQEAGGGAVTTTLQETLQRMARDTHTSEAGRGAALQYLFSAVNLGLAILLVRVRPGDLTARLLAIGMLGTAAVFNLPAHLGFHVLTPAFGLAGIFAMHEAFHFVGGAAYVGALLLFPDGRLPYATRGGIWRAPAAALYGLVVLVLTAASFSVGFFAEIPLGRLAFFGLLVPVVGIGAQQFRYRTATDLADRQQSRVLMLALAAAFAVTLAAGAVLLLARASGPSTLAVMDRLGFEVFPPLFAVIPVTLVAVLVRYRLWDIDRIVNRALVYGVLTGILGVGYFAVVVLVGRSVPLHRNSPLLVAVTTLIVAALFRPLRGRIQHLVDRRFYRERYDAGQAVRAFSIRLRAQVDLDELRAELLAIVEQTVHPRTATLALSPAGEDPTEPDGLVVPLVTQGELVGELRLGPSRSDRPYTLDDRELLNDLAGHAAPAVRVAQLVRRQEREARQRAQLDRELQVAQLIQHQFLPKRLPDVSGWTLAAHYQPAREVGGDFYDVIPLPGGHIGLALGDVTDKGIPAALVMAHTHSMLRAEAARLGAGAPGEVLARVNAQLVQEMPPGMFVTCLYGVLEPVSGTLRFANAGHCLPYCRTGDEVVELYARGMPLGLFEGMTYDEREIVVRPGASLLFHSDGLSEAHDARREMFGLPRLQRLIGEYPGGQALIDGLLTELGRFVATADHEQDDDITLLSISRSPIGRDGAVAASRGVLVTPAGTC